MTLDKLMYDWLATQVSGLLREEDENTNVEPPLIEYISTRFPRRPEAGDAESYPSVQIRIRVRYTSGQAFNSDKIETAVDSVISDLTGQTPSLSGYVALPLSLAIEDNTKSNEQLTYKDVVFLTTIAKGFAETPLVGGEGTATIVGLDGTSLGFVASVAAQADYQCSSDTETIETVSFTMPRATVFINWILADTVTPLPVVGSTVSVVFAHGTNYSWVESVKIARIDTQVQTRNDTQYQTARFTCHVDNADSPFFTGDAA